MIQHGKLVYIMILTLWIYLQTPQTKNFLLDAYE